MIPVVFIWFFISIFSFFPRTQVRFSPWCEQGIVRTDQPSTRWTSAKSKLRIAVGLNPVLNRYATATKSIRKIVVLDLRLCE